MTNWLWTAKMFGCCTLELCCRLPILF